MNIRNPQIRQGACHCFVVLFCFCVLFFYKRAAYLSVDNPLEIKGIIITGYICVVIRCKN